MTTPVYFQKFEKTRNKEYAQRGFGTTKPNNQEEFIFQGRQLQRKSNYCRSLVVGRIQGVGLINYHHNNCTKNKLRSDVKRILG